MERPAICDGLDRASRKDAETYGGLFGQGQVDESDDAGMSLSESHGELAEILVESHEGASLIQSKGQDLLIAGIAWPVTDPDHGMTVYGQLAFDAR